MAAYFISTTNGNDSNNGLSSTPNPSGSGGVGPWKTLAKLNSSWATILAGDTISLERGQTFTGTIVPTKSGTSGSRITINAYGSGARPIITGLVTTTGWNNTGLPANNWECVTNAAFTSTCNIVVVNGFNQPMGRFPKGSNTLSMDSGGFVGAEGSPGAANVGSQTMTDAGLSGIPSWVGGQICTRKQAFILDRSRVDTHSGTTMTFHRDFPNTINFTVYSPGSGQAYFLQDHPNSLTTINSIAPSNGEWWYDRTNKRLRMFSNAGAPTNVEIPMTEILVDLTSRSFFTFDNITFRGSNTAAIKLLNSSTIFVQNCDLLYNGYNGVWIGDGCSNYQINTNNITDTNNTAIEDGYNNNNSNILITGNVITNTSIIAGAGGSLDGANIGIYVGGISGTATNSTVTLNRVINCGYVGIYGRTQSFLIQRNFVQNFCTVKNDGGGIYTTRPGAAGVTSRQILENIVINGNTQGQTMGIYCDDSSTNITINDNSIYDIGTVAGGGNGIYLHSSHEVEVHRNNVCAARGAAFSMNQDQDTMANVNVTDCIFTMTNSTALGTCAFQGGSSMGFTWGTSNNNVIAKPISPDDNAFYVNTSANPFNHYTLANWKSASGHDAASTQSPLLVSDASKVVFLYNDTTSPVSIPLGSNTYVDMHNNPVSGSVSLAAFRSITLLLTGSAPPTARPRSQGFIIV